jgi:opacity protein-like surface antigen
MMGPALAADIPVKGPIYAPAWSWTGFYAGLQAGYGWSNNTVDLVSGGVGTNTDPALLIPGVTLTTGTGALTDLAPRVPFRVLSRRTHAV